MITDVEQYHRLHEVLTWLESLQEALPDGRESMLVEKCTELLDEITPDDLCLHVDAHPGWRDA